MKRTNTQLLRQLITALPVAALSCALLTPDAQADLTGFEVIQASNPNLVFQYRFEGGSDATRLADTSGNGYTLQRTSGTAGFTTNDIQFVTGFDGASQAYQPAYDAANRLNGAGLITSSTSVPLGANLTVEAVLQFNNYTGSVASVYVLCGRPTSGRAYFFRQNLSTILATTFGSNNADQPTVVTYTPGDWYYLAMTAQYNGAGQTTVNWYGANLSAGETNLQQYGSTDYVFSGDWTGNTSIGVGVFNNGVQEFMDGRMDNTAITSGILTTNDFQARLDAIHAPVPACQTAAILGDPANRSVQTPVAATFSVSAVGTAHTYQWQLSTNSGVDWNNVSGGTGGTTASYTTPATALSDSGNQYRCIVDVACDSSSATSAVATLTVNMPTLATWTGAVSTDWNTASNWNVLTVPSGAMAAVIPASSSVNYNSPAPSFSSLTNSGTLNINTNTFTNGFVFVRDSAARLFVNTNGLAGVSGNVALHNGARASIEAGGTLKVDGSLFVGSSTTGTGSGSTSAGHGSMTNNGGNLTASATQMNPTGGSIGTAAQLIINGGTSSLGAVRVRRQPSASNDKGLIVNGGQVTTTSITVEDNSYCAMFQEGGVVTNTGGVSIKMNGTTSRPARFVQNGGLFVTTDPNIVTLYPSGGNASIQTYYDVNGGTNIVGGFQLGVAATAGTARVRNYASMFIGSAGLNWDGVASGGFQLNGGVLGATADWTNTNAPITLAGGVVQAADWNGTPFNITMAGPLSGGLLTKTGGGTLTLDANNTYSGGTTINEGTLAIGLSGTLGAGDISVASGAVLDVSAPGTFSMTGSQRLAGKGTVVGSISTSGSGSQILPGGQGVAGTLTLSNDLTLNGSSDLLTFDFSDDPTGTTKTNDLLMVNNLNLNGATILINQLDSTLPNATFTLIKYSGSVLSGDVSFLSCARGTLTNDTTAKEIRLIVDQARPAADLVWTGDGLGNYWDIASSPNWLNISTQDVFYPGDTVHFTDAGSTNPTVNVVSLIVAPAGIVVDATTDYAFETFGGLIGGGTGLTKTNSGRLTIPGYMNNSYSGVTTISGGTLSLDTLSAASTSGPIGAASADPANIVVNGGALEYTGSGTTWDRGLTLGASGGTIAVVNGTLTGTGILTGPGKLTKSGPGQLTVEQSGNDYAGGTEVVAGTLRLDRNSNATLGTNTLTLNGAASTATFQFGGDGQELPNVLNVVNTNSWIECSGNNAINNLVGTGTLNINGIGSTFTVQGNMSAFSGTLAAGTLSNLRMHPSTGSASAVYDLGAGTCLLNNRNGNLTINVGALKGGPSTTVQGASSENNPTTYLIGGLGMDTVFEGVISEVATSRQANIVKVGAGTLTLTGTSSYTGATTVSNGTLQVDGSLGDTAVTVAGGTLAGTGTIGGPVTVQSGGNLAPGASIGTLTLSSNLTLNGTITVEVNSGAVPGADLITCSGTVILGGTLAVSNTGPALTTNDVFTLFSAAGVQGAFAAFSPAIPGPGLIWNTNTLTTDGMLRISEGVAAPTPTNLTFTAISGGQVVLDWPAGQGWKLQAQTNNSLSVGLSNNWVELTGATPPYTNTVDAAKPTTFFRLVYP